LAISPPPLVGVDHTFAGATEAPRPTFHAIYRNGVDVRCSVRLTDRLLAVQAIAGAELISIPYVAIQAVGLEGVCGWITGEGRAVAVLTGDRCHHLAFADAETARRVHSSLAGHLV
jgi:hypothetical protein